jgi:benzoylformate decarboxylase
MATGWALARRAPALAVLHTTAGLGNAVGALATARVNRAPLVVLVGQQDRRHLAHEPFLSGRLSGLAGEYPVWLDRPVRAQDVPGSIARAFHESVSGAGPAVVIVPMDDWAAPACEPYDAAAALRVVRARAADEAGVAELGLLLNEAERPALVSGAGSDVEETWAALVTLAERLRCPVWQEPFGARAGFPQDHPQFAGHLPADRGRLRRTLAPYDLVLAIGAPAFRQYTYEPGPLVEPGTRLALVSEDAVEAHRSPVELALVAPPASTCEILARLVAERTGPAPAPFERPQPPAPPGAGEPLRAGHVLAALAERLPRDAVVIEEAPSSRPELLARIPARAPLGFLSAAMGGLGFALPAAAGIRLAQPDRPVVAIVGDGSSLYAIQALWSAAHERAGVLYVILQNGGYAVMDLLTDAHGGRGPWPGFEVDVAGLARSLGCPARSASRHDELLRVLDEVVPTLATRDEPLLLEVAVAPEERFAA